MNTFQIIALILTFAALGGYVNRKYMKLPATIGNMAFALLLSLTGVVLHKFDIINLGPAIATVAQIDFSGVLLHGMLSFLLFAGALHIRLEDLKNVQVPVAVLSTVGTALATFITGTLLWWATGLAGLPIPYLYCLLFGALISPTDPIAVLALLKEAKVSKTLAGKIGGESLFNDGIGVVIFMTILGIAGSARQPQAGEVFALLVHEAMGGLGLGLFLGWITYRLLGSIDDYKVEVLLTLALVTGGYALAEATHVSAPICMAVAGLVIGNWGRDFGMSAATRDRLDVFWELVDEIFNAVLFMLIGLEVMVIAITGHHLLLGALAIGAVLAGRLVSVSLPVWLMSFDRVFEKGTIPLLTWGGLRGGISIALALSLPAGPEKSVILPVTYIVVLFSIFVQGLTFRPLIDRLVRKA